MTIIERKLVTLFVERDDVLREIKALEDQPRWRARYGNISDIEERRLAAYTRVASLNDQIRKLQRRARLRSVP